MSIEHKFTVEDYLVVFGGKVGETGRHDTSGSSVARAHISRLPNVISG